MTVKDQRRASPDWRHPTRLIRQYLAPDGCVISLQNCMNEETIAGIVGSGETLGCIASLPRKAQGHFHRALQSRVIGAEPEQKRSENCRRAAPCDTPARFC